MKGQRYVGNRKTSLAPKNVGIKVKPTDLTDPLTACHEGLLCASCKLNSLSKGQKPFTSRAIVDIMQIIQ